MGKRPSKNIVGLFFVGAIFALGLLAAGRLAWAAITQTATHSGTVQASEAKQLHYRWRNDDGGEQAAALNWATTSDPAAIDILNELVIDSSTACMVGSEEGADRDWRIECRAISNGALQWATTSDIGNNDYANDVAIDGSSLYVVGSVSDIAWYMQKRNITNGAVVWSTSSDPTGSDDYAYAVETDGTFMYVGGYQYSGQFIWRIEKRNLSDGVLQWAVTSSAGSRLLGSAIDSTYLYAVGNRYNGDIDLHIEKRNLSDGALVWATTSDPAGDDSAQNVVIDSAYMYIAETTGNTDFDWRIEKRNLSDGALVWATTTDPAGADELTDIEIDSSYAYLVGWESSTNTMWRIEKRALSDGRLVYATTTVGTTTAATSIDINGQNMYVGGIMEGAAADYNWYLESRTLGHDTSTATFSTAEDNPLLNLGVGTLARLRMLVQNAGDAVATSSLYRLEYATSTSGPWTRVGSPASTSVDWITSASAYLSSTQGTHNITGLTDPTSTVSAWYSGEFKSTSSQATLTSTLNPSQFTEYEFAVKPTGSSTLGIPYYFRLTNQGTSLDTYSIYASATLAAASISLTALTVNNGNAIILTPNATTTVNVNWTVSGGNGCGSVFYGASSSITSTLYRSGVSSTCANTPTQSTLNCYYTATTTNNCTSNTSTASANATTTFQVWYFAESTANTSTASSSYAGQDWRAFVGVKNGSGTTSTAVSASGVGLEALLAITLNSSTFNYGTVLAGTNTSGTNQTTNVKNAGNATTTLQVSGNAMSNGSYNMPTSSQHYATSTFTYGVSDVALTSAATAVGGWVRSSLLIGAWTLTTSTFTGSFQAASVVNNGYLYLVGGNNSGVLTSTVRYWPLNANGSPGSMSTSTPLPSPINLPNIEVYGNYLYSVGGKGDCCNGTRTVWFAPFNSTGSIGAWATTTQLPYSLEEHGTAVYNGYLYAYGGWPGANATATVLFAPIGATGSIGAWATTTALPTSTGDFGAVAYNGYLYVAGGFLSDGTPTTSAVYKAAINSTGSIGAWTSTQTLTEWQCSTDNFAADAGTLYFIGNCYGNEDNIVYFSPIGANGLLGAWTRGSSLNSSRAPATAIWNGYAYAVGGWADPTEMEYAPLTNRNLYWGLGSPATSTRGTYTSTITYTAVYSP